MHSMYILLAFPQTLHKKTSSKNVDFDKQESPTPMSPVVIWYILSEKIGQNY